MCTSNRLGASLRQAEVLDLPLPDQFLHGAGNIFVAGTVTGALTDLDGQNVQGTFAGMQDILVFKLDPDGTVVWAKDFGTAGVDYATAITLGQSGSVWVTGHAEDGVRFESMTSLPGGVFVLILTLRILSGRHLADAIAAAYPSLSSRSKPLLEMCLKALEHLFLNVFDVSELAPTSHIAVFRCSLNLHNKFFHQLQPVPVLFPEMLLANVRRLFLPILGSKSHIVPQIVTGTLLRDPNLHI